MGGSPQIEAFDRLRALLRANPRPEVWADPVDDYLLLARELATREDPPHVPILADLSAFQSQRNDAERAWGLLDAASDDLARLDDGVALAPDWMEPVLRAMQSVALVAAAWNEGLATMNNALRRLAADLDPAQVARDLVEGAGSRIAGALPIVLPISAGAIGLGLVVAVARRRR